MIIANVSSAASLPGGASSLVETYDDWSVVCHMQANAPTCAVRQVQTNNHTNQTVLKIEITKAADGKFRGALLSPLGLALPQGTLLKLDDVALGNALPFSTCLAQGCLVPLTLEADAITRSKPATRRCLRRSVSPWQNVSRRRSEMDGLACVFPARNRKNQLECVAGVFHASA